MVVLGFFYAGRIVLWLLFTHHDGLVRNKRTFQMDPNILAAVSVNSVEVFWLCVTPNFLLHERVTELGILRFRGEL